ncbi:MAG: aminotransferase class III-fold pyridoxal phosphate-dependent enzyme [Actinobacteria bacterium]|nr:aminotransferase class III-fold pyridoxal phosphate-dependent enzyme [Actinomycetota bacterium]
MIDRSRLAQLRMIEDKRFLNSHPKSGELFEISKKSMPAGVPMSWMSKWPGAYPVFVEEAKGARFIDVDGNSYIDFCLGDTGSMTGHSPVATVTAIKDQVGRGMSAMLPTKDAAIVSADLAARFNLPLWQFTVSATDANRHVIRYARLITGRKKIIVIDRCYHGSVDESFATLDETGATVAREGNIGAPVDLNLTTRVVAFNDLPAMKIALSNNDVAAILMEPAMTNVGIVLPEVGYLQGVEALAKEFGSLLIIDETHTISVGPGGMTGQLGLRPDFLTIGKAIGGGFPTGAFGMTQSVADSIKKLVELEVIDTGGVGGTLAANALSLAAMRATLSQVLTKENFDRMIKLGHRWADGVEKTIQKYKLPWTVNRLGARAEYMFSDTTPKTGRQAADAGDFELEQYIHLRMLNDGFLITPFHNMALISPDTTEADVDAHTSAFEKMCSDLTGG